MDWVFKSPTEQMDTVGNIVQEAGGVIAKACQMCSTLFDSKEDLREIKRQVPTYKCSCGYTNPNGNAAFEHFMMNKDHNLNKSTIEKVVRVERVIIGEVPHIEHFEDDVKILCSKCKGN